MKRTWLGVALLFFAFSSYAGVKYEFIQRTQSDIENIPSTELNGKAIIDGDLRVSVNEATPASE